MDSDHDHESGLSQSLDEVDFERPTLKPECQICLDCDGWEDPVCRENGAHDAISGSLFLSRCGQCMGYVKCACDHIWLAHDNVDVSDEYQSEDEIKEDPATPSVISEAKYMATQGNLDGALDSLTAVERLTRRGGDMHSNSKVLVAIVQICFEAPNFPLLYEQIITLTKKRSQLKQAVTKMVQECYSWIVDNRINSWAVELKLIETLRTVTEGKIYVEVERARLTHRLAQMQELEGDIQAAAKTMQELQVETFGSMMRKEKVVLILEQMRLCLATKDYFRTQIISRKISIKCFTKNEYQLAKLKFYEYMIEMDQHEGTYLNVCRHYCAIYDTPFIQEDSARKLMVLRHVALYVVLSQYDNEQSDLINRILKEKALEDIPLYKTFLELFTSQELIDPDRFCQVYEKDLRSGSSENSPTGVFDANTESGRKHWADLTLRIVEHNIRMIAKYFKRIRLGRMAELLGLSVAEAEDALSVMVVTGMVEAKTDRLEGIVEFKKRSQNANEMLNDWSNSISQLMSLVQKTTHLINKEEMVHKQSDT